MNSQTGELPLPNDRTFSLDYTFGPNTSQEEVYLSSLAPLLTTCLEGYSVSVLLYGAGATCKTHTLLGPDRGSALGGTAVRSGVQATE